MHDPLVVAFEIPRPWPARAPWRAGGWRFPSMVTVWHVEPGGHDSGEVCRHYDRPTGRALKGWKLHLHHWRIQIPALQELRRRLLTRCAWCGGGHRRRDQVNVSHSWDGPRGRWWQGEPGLYHRDCSAVSSAHAACLCAEPALKHGTYGRCINCGRSRSFGVTSQQIARDLLLVTISRGHRDRVVYECACEMVKAAGHG